MLTNQRIHHLLARQCALSPARIALADSKGNSITYQELNRVTEALASRLLENGLGKSQLVPIYRDRDYKSIISMIAILKAGAAFCPIDTIYPEDRVKRILDNCNSQVMISSKELTSHLSYPGVVLDLDFIWDDLLSFEGSFKAPRVSGEDPAYAFFTSGSTGTPKGVLIPHRALLTYLSEVTKYFNEDILRRSLTVASFSFDASIGQVFPALLHGGTLLVASSEEVKDGKGFRKLLEDHKITFTGGTPTLYRMLLESGWQGSPETVLLTGGEALTPQLANNLISKCAFILNAYGPTETTVDIIHEKIDRKTEHVAIGKALPNAKTYIVDSNLNQLPSGEAGELLLGGPQLALGYINNLEKTNESFIENPFEDREFFPKLYRTGDICREIDGKIYYLNRKDDQVKIRGYRVQLAEIESLLEDSAHVEQAVVLAKVLADDELHLVAYVRANGELSISDERARLEKALPSYMIPTHFVQVDSFPRNASGKVEKKALPLPLGLRDELDIPYHAPGTELEKLLSKVFAECLAYDKVGIEDQLFNLGLNSIAATKAASRLDALGQTIPLVQIFERPTVKKLCSWLETQEHKTTRLKSPVKNSGRVAIIGMAARTPGAENLDVYWDNLLAGRETLQKFSKDEISDTVPESERNHPNYVPVRGILEDVDLFDAKFFGISPMEARRMDPQQRAFLQSSWHAMEDGGYASENTSSRVGVYAGMGRNSYLQSLMLYNSKEAMRFGDWTNSLTNEKDYVATRVSHSLNLKGPSLNVQTACSTSLVAVIEACHAIRAGRCEMALAGGVSITTPGKFGHIYQEGNIRSKDGHCRPFDNDATGTLFTDGIGVVLLKEYSSAVRDGDRIYGVIEGLGMSNDGSDKASFTAPSIEGQVECIEEALQDAGVDGSEVSYVEAHGTGTLIGDPIETASLRKALNVSNDSSVKIGSVKGNIGHTVIAAGVLGLIKTAKMIFERTLVPSINLRELNSRCGFSDSFSVQLEREAWRGDKLLAGVSSFGVGGTNAHVLVGSHKGEETTSLTKKSFPKLLPLSAKSEKSLKELTATYTNEKITSWNLNAASYTLMNGRKHFEKRSYVLVNEDGSVDKPRFAKDETRQNEDMIWLFPGQGAQYFGMGRELYGVVPVFTTWIDFAAEGLLSILGQDLRRLLFIDCPESTLSQTWLAQPAIFAIELALAQTYLALGLRPSKLIGHSVGEFTAAVVAGVMSPEDALRLVAIRGKLMWSLPQGSMTSVRGSAEIVRPLLPKSCSIAANNSHDSCVMAGPFDEIARVKSLLQSQKIMTKDLHTSHAFHSPMMASIVPKFKLELEKVSLKNPDVEIISTVTGDPLTASQAKSSDYWSRHIVSTVDFLKAVRKAPSTATFLEVGPRGILTTLSRRQHKGLNAISSMSVKGQPNRDGKQFFQSLGDLYLLGYNLNWTTLLDLKGEKRCSLPLYPFEKMRHWIDFECNEPKNIEHEKNQIENSMEKKIVMNTNHRNELLLKKLADVFEDISGIDISEYQDDTDFFEMGFDSLVLTQVASGIESEFSIKISFRELIESLDNPLKLAKHLDSNLGSEYFGDSYQPSYHNVIEKDSNLIDQQAESISSIPEVHKNPTSSSQANCMSNSVAPPMPTMEVSDPTISRGNADRINDIVFAQIQLMQSQIAAMQGAQISQTTQVDKDSNVSAVSQNVSSESQTFSKNKIQAKSIDQFKDSLGKSSSSDEREEAEIKKQPFGAIARISKETSVFTPSQKSFYDQFVADYTKKTKASKDHTQEFRGAHADPRVVTGFKPHLKEIVYPLVMDRSSGIQLRDLDGNQYIDLTCGFGSNFFGNSPEWLKTRLKQQVDEGFEIGPQHHLAGKVSKRLCEFLQKDRVAFCNTGSEAVLGAMRVARTVTGRKKIAAFTGAYHGINDEGLVRGNKKMKSFPAAPGVTKEAIQNMLMLDYGTEESLTILKSRASELAAILVESVQSRRPDFRPKEFIQKLRKICDDHGCVLIIDEIITGFRMGRHGAQGYYGVEADLGTYGKIVGAGTQIAVIAGKKKYMDALDGGAWQYGDDSKPEVGVTYFAGTFVRHPLGLAAIDAVLDFLEPQKDTYHLSVTAKANAFVARMNHMFSQMEVPFEYVNSDSLMLLRATEDIPHVDLLAYLLRNHGIHTWWGFPNFLTLAHTDEDIVKIEDAFRSSLSQLKEAGFYTKLK